MYERLIVRGGVLLIHVGSAPWRNEYDGFPRFARVMTMFPEMKVIVAHMGQWETRRHLDLLASCRRTTTRTSDGRSGSPLPVSVHRKIFYDDAGRLPGL